MAVSSVELLSSIFDSSSGVLLLPQSPEYDEALKAYWHVGNQEIKPQVILRPKTTGDASYAFSKIISITLLIIEQTVKL
jgi:hypothetical protein